MLGDYLDLLVCIAALMFGPVVFQISTSKRSTYAFVDGFVLVSVGGLVLFEILPGTFATLGIWALPAAIFGFLFPHFLEHRLNSLPVSPRTILSSLIILGLVIHQLLDGAALSHGTEHEAAWTLTTLSVAVILHQVPKGFLLWEISRKAGGTAAAALVIAGLVASTTAGFVLGGRVQGWVQQESVLLFQAFVAGGLLHVVVHHVSGGSEGQPQSGLAFLSGVGAIAATAMLVALPHSHFIEAPNAATARFRSAFAALTLESSPPLLLGLFTAGIVQACISVRSLRFFQGTTNLSSALRGILVGIPLPICSCGVTPIYHAMVRRGIPAAAAVAFLIATPEIGLDSFFLSLRLLGLPITLVRLAMAFLIALVAALVLSKLYTRSASTEESDGLPILDGPTPQGSSAKLLRALRISALDLVDELAAWILVGLAVAALAEPYLDANWLVGLPPGLDVAILALLGLPIYVCASAATPLAAVLIAKGVSPGAVLAFLITGPTTNVTTFGILSRLHGKWRAAALPATVFALSVMLGLAANRLAPSVPAETFLSPETAATLLDLACTAVFLTLIAVSLLRLGPRRFLGRLLGESSLGDSGDADRPGDHGGHGHALHGHSHAHSEAHEPRCGCGPDQD